MGIHKKRLCFFPFHEDLNLIFRIRADAFFSFGLVNINRAECAEENVDSKISVTSRSGVPNLKILAVENIIPMPNNM